MNDYNSGALPDPCLRLDYGFGDDWKSVELGDGTGYVRLAEYEKVVGENAELKKAMDFQALELGCMTDSRDILYLKNEKLRKLLSSALIVAGFEGRQYLDTYLKEEEGTTLWQELKGLGIEVG